MALSKALGMDLPALAEMLRAKGRGKDTMLAHITPKEAALLKRRGGSGSGIRVAADYDPTSRVGDRQPLGVVRLWAG